MKKHFLTYLFLFSYFLICAQYKTNGEIQSYYIESEPNKFIQIDTGLLNIEEYNFEQQESWEYFNTGIIGSAEQKLNFSWNSKKGFNDGNIFFDNYKFDIEKIKRYIPKKFPFSELSYSIGSNLEQIARIQHVQNIKNRFIYSLDLYGMSSGGSFIEKQRTRNVALSFYGIYSSKNNKYHLGTDFTYSTIKASEIGGIVENVLTNPAELKFFHNSFLEDATTKQSELSFLIKNSYGIGFSVLDSVSDTLKVNKFYPVFKLKHSIGSDIVKNSFLDKSNGLVDSTYYGQFYQYKDSTYNKIAYHDIPHRIAFEYLGTKKGKIVSYRNIKAELAIQHNNIEIWQNNNEISSNNLMLEATVQSNILSESKISYNLNSYFILTGLNKNDFHFKGKIGYDFSKYGIVYASILYENISPNYIESSYHSNSINWNNSFSHKQIFEGNFTYLLKKHKLKFQANFDLLNNYIYFNSSSTPTQTNAKITYWNISIKKDLKWKFLNLNTFIGFQNSNHQEILALPNLFLKTSFYAEFFLFKTNLLLNTGFDLRYNSSFKARAWNPLISQFYIQDSYKMDYTPILDVFVNAKVKSVRIYMKINYVNEGLFVRNYYKALNLPSNGRTFSVGGSWRFFE